MPAQPISANAPQAETPSAADIWAQHAPHCVQLLIELADTGAAIVSLVRQRARMQADEPSHQSIMAEIYLPFDTPPLLDRHNKFLVEARESIDVLTRSIRRSIMLAEKIAQQPATAPSAVQNPNAARDRIRRDVEEALHRNDTNSDHERQDNEGHEAENVQAERPDRLDAPDPEDDPTARPVAHIIAEICRDLGLDALPASNPEKDRPPAASPPPPAAAPQAAAKPVTKYSKAPPPEAHSPANAHQPAPPTPPTPFPRL